ncbi:MAG: hypothetical protein Tsb0014_15710 [Pleurocapsa sp.]
MQSPATEKTNRYQLVCPQLPLAVYREVAAHLRQVAGVKAGLIPRPLRDEQAQFDYGASQIQALWLEYPQDLGDREKQQIEEILGFYGQRYGKFVDLV